MTTLAVKRTSNGHATPPLTLVKDIRVGVVGCGYWGPKIARNLTELPGAALSLACDLRPSRLADIKNICPQVQTTAEYGDLLKGPVDAIVVATPVSTHYRLAKAALLANKHVLVEKPLTARSDQAEELIELAADRGLTLMVGHTFEYNPAVEAVRDIVQSGEIGHVYYMNSTRANLGLLQPDINVMWDLGPHDISIMRFILGQDPVRVSAHGAVYINRRVGLHEVIYMNLIFEGDVLANLKLSWLDPVKERRLIVVGSQKMLVYDDIATDKVVVYDKGVEMPPYTVTEEEFRASYRHGGETIYPIDWTEPLRVECSHFLECIRSGAAPRSDGEDGLKVIRVLETAQRSLRNRGVELEIEY